MAAFFAKGIEMNKTAVRKQVRAIYYRLIDRRQWHCVEMHIAELLTEVPAGKLRDAIEAFAKSFDARGVTANTIIAYNHVVSLLPAKTYGELTAGTLFSVPGYFEVLRKTKAGIEAGFAHVPYAHLPSNQVVL